MPIKLHFCLSVWNSDSQSVAVELTQVIKVLIILQCFVAAEISTDVGMLTS